MPPYQKHRCAGPVAGNNQGLETNAYVQKISLINDARVKKYVICKCPVVDLNYIQK